MGHGEMMQADVYVVTYNKCLDDIFTTIEDAVDHVRRTYNVCVEQECECGDQAVLAWRTNFQDLITIELYTLTLNLDAVVAQVCIKFIRPKIELTPDLLKRTEFQEMVKSIARVGLIQPVILRRRAGRTNLHDLVNGRLRCQATLFLGNMFISAKVVSEGKGDV